MASSQDTYFEKIIKYLHIRATDKHLQHKHCEYGVYENNFIGCPQSLMSVLGIIENEFPLKYFASTIM